MELNIIYIIFSILFGACFGSFITMASYRLPRNEDIFIKRSHCPNCNNPLKAISLIPVISWLMQGGKCLSCGKKISIRYPLTEIITAFLFLLSYLKFGVSLNTILLDLIIVVCTVMVITDLENYIFPDSMQLSLLVFTLVFIFYNKIDLLQAMLSGFVYFLTFFLSGYLVKLWKKTDAIGWGDIKFVAIVGMLLGTKDLPIFLFTSGVIGVIFGIFWTSITKNKYFPFGPALIVAFLSIFYYIF